MFLGCLLSSHKAQSRVSSSTLTMLTTRSASPVAHLSLGHCSPLGYPTNIYLIIREPEVGAPNQVIFQTIPFCKGYQLILQIPQRKKVGKIVPFKPHPSLPFIKMLESPDASFYIKSAYFPLPLNSSHFDTGIGI